MTGLLAGNGSRHPPTATRLVPGMRTRTERSTRLPHRNHQSLTRMGTFGRSVSAYAWLTRDTEESASAPAHERFGSTAWWLRSMIVPRPAEPPSLGRGGGRRRKHVPSHFQSIDKRHGPRIRRSPPQKRDAVGGRGRVQIEEAVVDVQITVGVSPTGLHLQSTSVVGCSSGSLCPLTKARRWTNDQRG